ncbi:MAG: hypothetical protein OXC64_06070 [Flavobacteriaceae bacterium]|nr:hypothetical protein [Flavobacteriaceae bacterium]
MPYSIAERHQMVNRSSTRSIARPCALLSINRRDWCDKAMGHSEYHGP